jgi:hypothetical protein
VFTNHNGIPIPKNASRVLVMVQTQVALLGYTTHVMFSIGPHTHTHTHEHTHTHTSTHTQWEVQQKQQSPQKLRSR